MHRCQADECLAELSLLIGRGVQASELSSPEEAMALAQHWAAMPFGPVVTWTMPFADKTSPGFSEFIRRLINASPNPVVPFTPRTINCGFIALPSLEHVKLSFPFDINPEGILSIVMLGGSDRIVLDWFHHDDGAEMLEVEVHGRIWPAISYGS